MEPIGLCKSDSRRPDSVALILWNLGSPLAWDVTVPDTFAISNTDATPPCPLRQVLQHSQHPASISKLNKYIRLATTLQLFIPIPIETEGIAVWRKEPQVLRIWSGKVNTSLDETSAASSRSRGSTTEYCAVPCK